MLAGDAIASLLASNSQQRSCRKSIHPNLQQSATHAPTPVPMLTLRLMLQAVHTWAIPDRAVLIGRILPALSKPGTTILWVGCRAYTRRYPVMIERQGAECWTLEIDPDQRRWGHPKRHTVGDLQNVEALYPLDYFHVALVNGVFGWGLDTLDGQNEAVEGLARILKPNGMLMLGWNTDRSSDPTKLPAIEQFFVPSLHPRFDRRITFPTVTHVYDFLSRKNSA
jgi:SAM-dependent methyltransferase